MKITMKKFTRNNLGPWDQLALMGAIEREATKVPSTPVEPETFETILDVDTLTTILQNLIIPTGAAAPQTGNTTSLSDNIPGPLDQFNVTELVGLNFFIVIFIFFDAIDFVYNF